MSTSVLKLRSKEKRRSVMMDFDRLGRRTFYRETANGQQVTFTRFLYDGYVMIQQVFSNSPYNIYKVIGRQNYIKALRRFLYICSMKGLLDYG